MLLKTLITLVFFSLSASCLAQTDSTFYFKSDGKQVKFKDSADYVRIISKPDSGSVYFKVKEYYNTGQLKLTGESVYQSFPSFEGEKVTYYSNGAKESTSNYNKGKIIGFVYEYFPNGKPYIVREPIENFVDDNIIACYDSTGKQTVVQGNGYYKAYSEDFKVIAAEGIIKDGKRDGKWLFIDKTARRTEIYADQKFVEGVTITNQGDSIKYTQKKIMPEFPGGVSQFYKLLEKNIKYPKEELKNKIEGTVIVTFTVEKDGSLSDIVAARTPSEALGAEAVRAVQMSPRWRPGLQYGLLVKASTVLPIKFSLRQKP